MFETKYKWRFHDKSGHSKRCSQKKKTLRNAALLDVDGMEKILYYI